MYLYMNNYNLFVLENKHNVSIIELIHTNQTANENYM